MPTRDELTAKHGTPEEFERAVWEAYCNLFVTKDEAEAAIIKYREEWSNAKDQTPQDEAPHPQVLRLEEGPLG